MVSVAWLFVFSKFIELTDTVSELLRRPCHCLLGGELGPSVFWVGASFSPASLIWHCFSLASLPRRPLWAIAEATLGILELWVLWGDLMCGGSELGVGRSITEIRH